MSQSIAGKGKDTSPRRIEKSASADSGGIKSDMRVNEGEGSSDNNMDALKEIERLSSNGKELQSKYTQLSDVYSKVKEENAQMHVVLENLFKKEAAVLSENGSLVAQNEIL